jgi:DNA-binding IclR family transcriptional regulator
MHGRASEAGGGGDQSLERAIVLLLLGGEREQGWPLGQLATELGADSQTLERALDGLSRFGVVSVEGGQALASRATRRIDELGLIGI